MAAAGVGDRADGNLQRLQSKKETVKRMVNAALSDLGIKAIVCTISHDGVAYLGGEPGWRGLEATAADWKHVLSQGLGTTFTVDWDSTNYFDGDLLILRLGEPIFDFMRSRGLNPEWGGAIAGNFTITAVDEAGAKLAVAMALHSRLGTDSPLSRVSSVALVLSLVVVPAKCSSPSGLKRLFGAGPLADRTGSRAPHRRTSS
jgi:hypothetical protein